eukprot:gene9210-biopygen5855
MNRLYLEVQRLSGVEDPVPLPDRRHWRLHLKNNTPLDAEAVFALPTAKESTVEYLREAWRFMQPERYEGLMTSRDLKATQLSQAEIDEAIRMGKFEVLLTHRYGYEKTSIWLARRECVHST